MKLIKVINGKSYEVVGSPCHHHQSGWHFPNSSRVKDDKGNVIECTQVKKNILTQISNIEIEKNHKNK